MNDFNRDSKWRTSTGLAFWGTAVQVVFFLLGFTLLLYLVYNVYDIFLSLFIPYVSLGDYTHLERVGKTFLDDSIVCFVIASLGYIVYLVGICLWRGDQQSIFSEMRVRDIIIAEFIMPIEALILYLIYHYSPQLIDDFDSGFPIILVAWAGLMVAVIILLVQFRSLSKEETWSEKARKGADDLKFSYSCVLWIQGVIIFGIGMILLTVYSSISKLQSVSIDKYGNTVNSAVSIAQEAQNLVGIVKVIMMCMFIMVFILAVVLTIYRITGWYKIKKGVSEGSLGLDEKQGTSIKGHFCHKCGAQLPDGSVFCPACGLPVAVVEESESQSDVQTETENTQKTEKLSSGITIEYEDEEVDKKKKWILWAGIAAGVIAVAAAIWVILGRNDKFEPNSKIYADRSVVFKSVEDGVGVEALDELIFGTSIEILTSGQDVNNVWAKVAYEANGKIVNGYMVKDDLLNTEDFEAIYKAGLSDGQARFHLPGKGQRLAVLDAVKGNGAEWHLEGIKLYGEAQPNAKRLYVRGADPSEVCLGFVMRNSSTGERKFFLYSTPDPYSTDITNPPVFLYSETPGKGEDIVYDAYYRKKGNTFDVVYQTNSDSDESEDFLYEGSAIDEEEVLETERVLGGSTEMSGYVDGKYPVKIEMTLNGDGTVSGTVTYLKYNVPMKLTGTYTDGDGYRDLSLDELSEGKVTGNFIGKYDGNSFSGSWVSADGEKEMPFKVER